MYEEAFFLSLIHRIVIVQSSFETHLLREIEISVIKSGLERLSLWGGTAPPFPIKLFILLEIKVVFI